jgi:predicted phage terminase large subunit-like protein
MQRLHEDDLTGYLLKKNPNLWHLISLPIIADKRSEFVIKNKTIIREQGELLHKEREGEEEIAKIKIELGAYAFAAQYLQYPLLKKGTVIRSIWFQYYAQAPENLRIIQSWDTAIKAGVDNDYSVCTTWGEAENGYYLIDVIRRKLEYPTLKKLMISYARKWKASIILIEDKASGQSLIQDLRAETKLPIIAIKPIKDKFTRLVSVSGLFEVGKIFLPLNAYWKEEYELEIISFPYFNHDDQVDSTSQFLNYITKKNYQDLIVQQLWTILSSSRLLTVSGIR